MVFTFLVEIILALILWFVLKKLLRTANSYAILALCLTIALAAGYVVAYRGIGFQITQDYLERTNKQKIDLTGESITLEEENAHKEELFRTEEFKKALLTSSAKTSLYPFVLVLLTMLFFVFKKERGVKNLKN